MKSTQCKLSYSLNVCNDIKNCNQKLGSKGGRRGSKATWRKERGREKKRKQIAAIKPQRSCAKHIFPQPSKDSEGWEHCYCCSKTIGQGSMFTCPGSYSL